MCDAHRVYFFFKGGKDELHFHLLEMKDVISLGKSAVTITYQLLSDKVPNVVELYAPSPSLLSSCHDGFCVRKASDLIWFS